MSEERQRVQVIHSIEQRLEESRCDRRHYEYMHSLIEEEISVLEETLNQLHKLGDITDK